MNYKEYKHLVAMDSARYEKEKKNPILFYLTNKTYRLTIRFRRVQLFRGKRLLLPVYYLERILYHRSCDKCGCDIPSHTQIGGGYKLLHSWGVVINSHAIIGENFSVMTGALIGANSRGVPHIGDNVMVGGHAIIIGNVKIGNNVKIGAGAIVTHDVPDNSVVVGDSAHILEK